MKCSQLKANSSPTRCSVYSATPIGGGPPPPTDTVYNPSMKAVALVFAFVLSLQARAQYDPFPDTPENHWVYKTLYKLQSEKIVDIGLGLFFRGGRPSDRMELAQYTVFACNAMIYKLERAEHDSTSTTARSSAVTLHMLSKETNDLAKMVALFAPEIKKRRVDADGLRREMLSFPKRIERIAGVPLGDDPDSRVVAPTEL